ncbi:AMP-binding protein, partial [Streptomyces sp. NPDC048304]|uniref:AMP-binding protein n=1 Tax=Streptomyces sp. NPDC048304 TaxID=3154820 RepID=UPI0033DBCBC5
MRTDLIKPLPVALLENATRFPDKVAFADDRRAVTYRDLEARTRRLAGHLARLGVERGDRVAICLGNTVSTVESYLAIVRAGGIGVPLNPASAPAELEYLLADSGASLVVTDAARAERFRGARGEDPGVVLLVTGEIPEGLLEGAGVHAYDHLADREPSVPARDDLGLDDVAWMFYTSGTTGRPKGVLSTQANCLWSVASCYVPIPGLTDRDRVLWPLPLFHSLSHIACVLSVTVAGATARLMDGSSAEDVMRVLREDGSTFLAGVPTTYHHLVAAARHSGFRAPDLRIGLVGGAVTGSGLRRDFEETFGVPLVDAYGSTETCGAITMNPPHGARVDGSCGLPVPGVDVRIVDPATGADVPAGQEGEVWVSGPNVMVGYHNSPEATAEAMRDGWFRTGDLARRDEAGYFTICGRIKELVIRGGENIHPEEVEAVLRTVEGVADAAVAGAPHATLGEVPVAYVIPGPTGFDPASLVARCREQLSAYKVPERIHEVTDIPRTASGKIKRRLLAEQPGRLRYAASGHHDTLMRVEWVPAPEQGDTGAAEKGWALVGPGAGRLVGALEAAGAAVRHYPDLAAVRAAVADGEPVPDVTVLVPPAGAEAGPDADAIGAGRSRARLLAEDVDAWLARPELAASRLVILTHGAVAADLAGGARDDRRREGSRTEPEGHYAVIPEGYYGVIGESEPTGHVQQLAEAPLWAVARSHQEARPQSLTVVDVLDGPDALESPDTLVAALASAEPQLAVRSGALLVPRLTRLPVVDHPQPDPWPGATGTVLVTGADTEYGAALAHRLATVHRARNLLLVSAPGATGSSPGDELAFAGTSVIRVTADAARPEPLRDALADLRHPVTAVVLASDAPELALCLDHMTAGEDLSAFVVVSSRAAGLLGSPDDPAAAVDALLCDAVVRNRRLRHLPGSYLAWGGRPGEGDGSAPTGEDAGRPPQELLSAFDIALTTNPRSPLAVLPGAPAHDTRVPAILRSLVEEPSRRGEPGEAVAAALRDRLSGMGERARLALLEDLVRTQAADVLRQAGPELVPADRAFRDLGFTSMAVVALRNRLTEKTGLRLPTTVAFDHPTPAAVAAFLRSEILKEPTPAPVTETVTAADPDEPLAIVGMACRLPGGVSSPEELWKLVADGVDAVTGFPEDRGWDLEGLFDPDPERAGTTYTS